MTPSTADALASVEAILFDFGGTLDADGVHWLDRFYALYAATGRQIAPDDIRSAFDFAEICAARDDEAIRDCGLDEMLERHLRWQFSSLGINDRELERQLAAEFVNDVRKSATRNRSVLEHLVSEGFRLGVISNGCGNTSILCDELGFTRFLEVVLDSAVVGLAKPDPQFFRYTADRLRTEPQRILMVGDSLSRDVEPAKAIGMKTAWLNADENAPTPATVDVRIRSVAELCEIIGHRAIT